MLLGYDYYAWQNPADRDPVQGPARPGIGEGTHLEGTIVDRNAAVGRNCIITNTKSVQEGEGPGFYIRDGIVVLMKNSEIPDGTII